MEARPMVTAGLRCAPLKVPTAYTATVTPNAHPAVMTIQPAFWPLVLLSTTLATTPSPKMTSSMVPSSSATKGGIRVNGKRRSYQCGSALSTDWGLACPRAAVRLARMARAALLLVAVAVSCHAPGGGRGGPAPPLPGGSGITTRINQLGYRPGPPRGAVVA